jgi:hypothetical protein
MVQSGPRPQGAPPRAGVYAARRAAAGHCPLMTTLKTNAATPAAPAARACGRARVWRSNDVSSFSFSYASRSVPNSSKKVRDLVKQ